MNKRLRIVFIITGGCLLIGGTLLFFYLEKHRVKIWYFIPYQRENGWAVTLNVVFEPKLPIVDLAPKIKKRCTQTLQWSMFDDDVTIKLYYPRSKEEIAFKVKSYVTSVYSRIEQITEIKPPGLEAYIYSFPMRLPFRYRNYTSKISCPEGFASIAFLFFKTKTPATVSEVFAEKIHCFPHEIGHIILYQKVSFNDTEEETTRWFDEGFASYLADRVVADIGLSNKRFQPLSFSDIIEHLENLYVRNNLYKWRLHPFIANPEILSLAGDANNLSDFWAKEHFLYSASHAVMLAIETIGGEGTIKDILKTIFAREEKRITPDELFEIVEQHLGFDIRDWDKFINAYKEKVKQVANLPDAGE